MALFSLQALREFPTSSSSRAFLNSKPRVTQLRKLSQKLSKLWARESIGATQEQKKLLLVFFFILHSTTSGASEYKKAFVLLSCAYKSFMNDFWISNSYRRTRSSFQLSLLENGFAGKLFFCSSFNYSSMLEWSETSWRRGVQERCVHFHKLLGPSNESRTAGEF